MKNRWQLLHATDFQSLMYPCFFYCGILGIFPYKINASNFEISKPRYILSIVIICVSSIICLLVNHGIIISKVITLGSIVRDFEAVCFLTFNGLIMILTHILSNPRMRLLQKIWEISSKLLPSKTYQKLSRLIHTKDVLSAILIAVQEYLYFSKIRLLETNLWIVNCLITAFIIYLLQLEFHMNMLYVNCVCVLKACFKKINDDLNYMQKLMTNDMRSSVPSLICSTQRNQIFLIELKTLMKQHLMINETVQLLNIIFSLQLLATATVTFIQITRELYDSIVHWQGDLIITFDQHFLDAFSTTMVHYVMKVVPIVWACETGKNQAREISTTIYDVLNNTRDEQIKGELQLFSLQILHCKNTFLTKGLAMDATLLVAMVGGITTYMLILIQFLFAAHSCDETFGISITNNSVI
ncbi:Putative gustatory receptor 28b [Trachymyrmex zeteki]|uniref:Gustatory receptor n=2 Tax=Mycetomoellerius zeteki TaxID=64791 RepID=A0A151XHI2_9HYME|nr:Putative gustatory receptor 28b [Trachymyrmex zeteki]